MVVTMVVTKVEIQVVAQAASIQVMVKALAEGFHQMKTKVCLNCLVVQAEKKLVVSTKEEEQVAQILAFVAIVVVFITVIMAYLLVWVCPKEKEATIMVCLLAQADPAAVVSAQAWATLQAQTFALHRSLYFLIHNTQCTT